MTINVSILSPNPKPPATIKLEQLKRQSSGTIAKLATKDQNYRFVVITGDVYGINTNNVIFDTDGKGWQNTDFIVLPDAVMNITFSE